MRCRPALRVGEIPSKSAASQKWPPTTGLPTGLPELAQWTTGLPEHFLAVLAPRAVGGRCPWPSMTGMRLPDQNRTTFVAIAVPTAAGGITRRWAVAGNRLASYRCPGGRPG